MLCRCERRQAGDRKIVVSDDPERAAERLLRAGIEARVAGLPHALQVGEPEERQALGVLRIDLHPALELRRVCRGVAGCEAVQQATGRPRGTRLGGRASRRVPGQDPSEQGGGADYQHGRPE
jgi:hypothetical protein